MATTIGELVWKINGDTKDVDKSLQNTEKKLSSFGKVVVGAFSAGAVIAFGRRIFDVGKKVLDFAGDSVESLNAVQVVFGDAAGIIEDFGKTAVDSVGLTQTSFNELSTIIGAQLKQSGLDIDLVAEKTVELTQRAADTASVFNTEVNDALLAFGAALRGESEPARRFAVNISDAAVQAEALSSGLVKSKDEITDQIKVQARFNLIMQQSEQVSGDFANTQGSFANQIKIAKANVQELGAVIGEDLIPTATRGINIFNELITDIIESKKALDEYRDAADAATEGTATAEQQIVILRSTIENANATIARLGNLQDANAQRAVTLAKQTKANALEQIGFLQQIIAEQERLDAIERQREENAAGAGDREQARADARIRAANDYLEANTLNTQELMRQQNLAEETATRERAAAERIQEIYDLRTQLREADEKAEEERHAQRLANIQAELAAYSTYAGNVGNIFSNLISALTAGDKELTEKKKKNIIALYRLQQAANIAQIAIDTAAAIIRLWANPGFPAAIPLSVVVGALGATQLAVVAATPPPALQDGGIVPAAPGGTTVIAGEQGVPEAIVPLDSANNLGNMTLIVNLDGSPIIKRTQLALNNREIVVYGSSVDGTK